MYQTHTDRNEKPNHTETQSDPSSMDETMLAINETSFHFLLNAVVKGFKTSLQVTPDLILEFSLCLCVCQGV